MDKKLKILLEYIKLDNGNFDYNYSEENPFIIVSSWNAIKEFNNWAKKNHGAYLSLEVGMITTDDEDKWLDFLTDGNWGFSDEWLFCSESQEPIHHGHEPYWVHEGYVMSSECIRENHAEEYINEYLVINWEIGVPSINLPLNRILPTETLEQFGFCKVKEDLEVGMYGTYDDPVKLLKDLTEENHDSDFVVHCTSNNPFATYYEIWERKNVVDN